MMPAKKGPHARSLAPEENTTFHNHYLPSYTDDSPRVVILTVSLLTTIAALTRMSMIDHKHTNALHVTLVDLIGGGLFEGFSSSELINVAFSANSAYFGGAIVAFNKVTRR